MRVRQQAMYNEASRCVRRAGRLRRVRTAQYCEGGSYGGYGGGGYWTVTAAMGNMPMGMPTGGFAPPAVPPNMIAGAPQWGMPITGTPIGLPGPPHVPLGVPAGLQKHVMKNRTRVMMPPPVAKMQHVGQATAGSELPAAC